MTWILKRIPIPVLLLAAGLVAGAAAIAHVHFEIQKAAARKAGPPPILSAGKLGTHRSFPWFDEDGLRLQIAENATYIYWDEGGEYPVLFFVDPAQDGSVTTALGAIAFADTDAVAMGRYMDRAFVGQGALGPIFEMTGVPQFLPSVTHGEIRSAAAELGLSLADEFLYLDPHFQGRATRIAPRPEVTYAAAVASVLLIWLAMIAQILRRRARLRSDAALQNAVQKGLVAASPAGLKPMMSESGEAGPA